MLDPHASRALKGIDADERVTRVDEHLLVLLGPVIDVDLSREPGAVPRVLEGRRGHLTAVPLHAPRRRGVD
jgi:hypothetical protein